jgi:hypothetical protein
MDLYIRYPTFLHGVVLNKLSTGTTLPVTFRGTGSIAQQNTVQYLHELSNTYMFFVMQPCPLCNRPLSNTATI